MPAVDAIETRPLLRPGKPVRLMATLSPRDDVRWGALAERIAVAVGPRLSSGVLVGRVVGHGERLRLALQGARQASAALSDAGPMLATDVRDFYPSVRPSALGNGLSEAGADPSDARAAAEMAASWEERGHRGLPIGPPASAVIACALLASVDRAVGDRPFLRWVDDYLIGVTSEEEGDAVRTRLDEALGRLGLERSEPKSRFLPRGAAGPWPGSLSAGEDL